MEKIKSLEELKALSTEGLDCFINLGWGRSSKNIHYNPNTDMWTVFHEIDGTEDFVSTEDLDKQTNIIVALDRGALYKY